MCRVAHSVLEHRLGATSAVTFITKRLVYCVHRGRFAPLMVGGYGGDRRPQRLQALGGYWGELPAMLDMDFGERAFHALG
jgi:hypothetical protein